MMQLTGIVMLDDLLERLTAIVHVGSTEGNVAKGGC